MKQVKITIIRKAEYRDLMERYENPIEHACDMQLGAEFISQDAMRPDGMCESAWMSLQPFVFALASGASNLYDGWMRNPHSNIKGLLSLHSSPHFAIKNTVRSEWAIPQHIHRMLNAAAFRP